MSERHSIWKNPPRGFRVMLWDPAAILMCAVAVWFAWPHLAHWSLVAPYVLGTFFLYCNVFRVRRSFELLWAAAFLVNAVVGLALWPPTIWVIVGLPSALAGLLIALEVCSPRYRGIGSGWFAQRRRSARTGLL